MEALWERPAVEARPAHRAPFGPGVTDVNGCAIRASLETLEALIAEQVRAAHPSAGPEAVRAAQQEAAQAWLDLLNQSIAAFDEPLDATDIRAADRSYSFEFAFLANEYGQQLSRAPDFAPRTAARLIAADLDAGVAGLGARQAYAMLPWAIRKGVRADVRVVADDRSAEVEWHPGPELAALRPEDHPAYLHMQRSIYLGLLRDLPRLVSGLPPAEVREETSALAGGPCFRWRVAWQERARPPLLLLAGAAASALLAVLAAAVEGLDLLAWVALLPAAVGVLGEWGLRERRARAATDAALRSLSAGAAPVLQGAGASRDELRRQVDKSALLHDITLALGVTLERPKLIARLMEVLTQQLRFDRVILLLVDEERRALVYGDVSHPATSPELQFRLESLQLSLDAEARGPLVTAWLEGQSTLVRQESAIYSASRLSWLFSALELSAFLAVPLRIGERLVGVIIVDNDFTGRPIEEEDERLLSTASASIAIALENARLYSLTDEQLSARVAELNIQQQIDRELNASLRLDRVMTLTLDWALRFTNADAGALALYDASDDALRYCYGYGYGEAFKARYMVPIAPEHAGIAGRVVRTGAAQRVEDVSQDPSYVEMAPDIRAQVAVPIVLEHRVVGVLMLESKRPSAFSQEQVQFAERLADRAAVAIENTRLFDQTQHEREKLSTILASIADGVVVVGIDGRLELVNVAARSIFRLDPLTEYRGMLLADVFAGTPLLGLYARAAERGRSLIDEIALSDDRTYHVRISPVQDIGWVLVIQDVTRFKEIDRLKSELVTTVSHDLKNPLNVLGGYVELIEMRGNIDDKLAHYLNMIRRSMVQMRQLIDDLLDMARIESGIELELESLDVRHVLGEAVDALQSHAAQKAMRITIDIENGVPRIRADRNRLRQVVINLLSNAIKYTPPQGEIRLTAEPQDRFVLISISDNGMGIAPEDQAKVFSRFYRVCRPETDGIEGTGLGLAIVKSLVEKHGGEVGLESRLGEGSTFHFTMPRADV